MSLKKLLKLQTHSHIDHLPPLINELKRVCAKAFEELRAVVV